MHANRTVAVFIGSLRHDSLNRRLALALAGLAPKHVVFSPVRLDDLPPYNQDDDERPGEAVRRLKHQVEAADALLFVTPEYNRSLPGVLKNALDIGSRPQGRNSFAHKPAGVIGASTHVIGTALAQEHLRSVLAYLDVPTMGQPEAFIHFTEGLIGANGKPGAESTRAFLQSWLDNYLEWVEHHLAGRAARQPKPMPQPLAHA